MKHERKEEMVKGNRRRRVSRVRDEGEEKEERKSGRWDG